MAAIRGGRGGLTARLQERRRLARGPGKRLNIDETSSIRAEAVSLTVDVVDIVSAAGVRFPGTALPGIDLADCMREAPD